MSISVYLELKKHIEQNNFICPMPNKWLKLYVILIDLTQLNSYYKLEIPLIKSHWDSPNSLKRKRFQDHLEYGFKNGDVKELDSFLRSLEDEDWLKG